MMYSPARSRNHGKKRHGGAPVKSGKFATAKVLEKVTSNSVVGHYQPNRSDSI